jgi:fucose permease
LASPDRRGDLLGLGSFVALGLPDGMLGTAWPSVRHSFGVPVGDLGLVLLVVTAGSVAVAAVVARLIDRFGIPVLLALAAAIGAAGAVSFALAPGFGVLLGLAALFGLAAGMLDSGLNIVVGLAGRPRLLNLLHGFYGVGTAIGPLGVTLALLAGSWRWAYAGLVVVDLGVAVLWVRQRRTGPGPQPGDSDPSNEPGSGASTAIGSTAVDSSPVGSRIPASSGRSGGGRKLVLGGVLVFFVYTGLEVSGGQWEASYDRGHLHLSASVAGLATFGYWAALTVVRVALALLPRPPGNQRVVTVGSATALVAAGLIWWQPDTAAALVGFVLLGASLAGVFPALIALTPERVGRDLASRAIAWQVGAAAAGGAGLSALLGLLITTAGLAVVGPALTVGAAALILVELGAARSG